MALQEPVAYAFGHVTIKLPEKLLYQCLNAPDESKTNSIKVVGPPVKPDAGTVLVYDVDGNNHKVVSKWLRADQYRFSSEGRPQTRSLFYGGKIFEYLRIFHGLRGHQRKRVGGFYRQDFYVEDSPYLVLHYYGDHTKYKPIPHGNDKESDREYGRSYEPTTLLKAEEQLKVPGARPKETYVRLTMEHSTEGAMANATAPRNAEQTKNISKKVEYHDAFFNKIKKCLPLLTRCSGVIVTDGEFILEHMFPNIVQMRNVDEKMAGTLQRRNDDDDSIVTTVYVPPPMRFLLKQQIRAMFEMEDEQKFDSSWEDMKVNLQKKGCVEFVDYMETGPIPTMKKGARWVQRDVLKMPDWSKLFTTNPAESLNALLMRIVKSKNQPEHVVVQMMADFQAYQKYEIERAMHGRGNWHLDAQYEQLLRNPQMLKSAALIRPDEIVDAVEKVQNTGVVNLDLTSTVDMDEPEDDSSAVPSHRLSDAYAASKLLSGHSLRFVGAEQQGQVACVLVTESATQKVHTVTHMFHKPECTCAVSRQRGGRTCRHVMAACSFVGCSVSIPSNDKLPKLSDLRARLEGTAPGGRKAPRPGVDNTDPLKPKRKRPAASDPDSGSDNKQLKTSVQFQNTDTFSTIEEAIIAAEDAFTASDEHRSVQSALESAATAVDVPQQQESGEQAATDQTAPEPAATAVDVPQQQESGEQAATDQTALEPAATAVDVPQQQESGEQASDQAFRYLTTAELLQRAEQEAPFDHFDRFMTALSADVENEFFRSNVLAVYRLKDSPKLLNRELRLIEDKSGCIGIVHKNEDGEIRLYDPMRAADEKTSDDMLFYALQQAPVVVNKKGDRWATISLCTQKAVKVDDGSKSKHLALAVLAQLALKPGEPLNGVVFRGDRLEEHTRHCSFLGEVTTVYPTVISTSRTHRPAKPDTFKDISKEVHCVCNHPDVKDVSNKQWVRCVRWSTNRRNRECRKWYCSDCTSVPTGKGTPPWACQYCDDQPCTLPWSGSGATDPIRNSCPMDGLLSAIYIAVQENPKLVDSWGQHPIECALRSALDDFRNQLYNSGKLVLLKYVETQKEERFPRDEDGKVNTESSEWDLIGQALSPICWMVQQRTCSPGCTENATERLRKWHSINPASPTPLEDTFSRGTRLSCSVCGCPMVLAVGDFVRNTKPLPGKPWLMLIDAGALERFDDVKCLPATFDWKKRTYRLRAVTCFKGQAGKLAHFVAVVWTGKAWCYYDGMAKPRLTELKGITALSDEQKRSLRPQHILYVLA